MAHASNKWQHTLQQQTHETYVLILHPEFHLECYDIDDDLWQRTSITMNTLVPRMMLRVSSH